MLKIIIASIAAAISMVVASLLSHWLTDLGVHPVLILLCLVLVAVVIGILVPVAAALIVKRWRNSHED